MSVAESSGAAAGEPPAPTTERGRATRRALVDGARRVFERDGFVDARIVDIAREAGVATGSFYTYFRDKESALNAVLAEVQEQMMELPRVGEHRRGTLADQVARAHRAYLETYRDNARLMALREQVAAVDPAFREQRRLRARAFVDRNARAVARLQAAGLADPRLDPKLAARAVSGMVSRAAYDTFVLGDEAPLEELVRTLTRLWMGALGIPDDAPASPAGQAAQGAG